MGMENDYLEKWRGSFPPQFDKALNCVPAVNNQLVGKPMFIQESN